MLQYPAPSPFTPLDPPVRSGDCISAWGWMLPMGIVETTLQPDAQWLRNTTIPWLHLMHNGTVTRTVISGAGIKIRTVGEGVNFTPIVAFLNDKLGKLAFEGLDTKTRNGYVQEFGDN